MDTSVTVLRPPPWSMNQRIEETMANAEKLAREGKAPCTPPRHILQYLVRLGSFTLVPALMEDVQDADFHIPARNTRDSLLSKCMAELPCLPISRNFSFVLKVPRELGFIKSTCCGIQEYWTRTSSRDKVSFRIMTWNVLAQALAESHDNFVGLEEGTLHWESRRLRILYEILRCGADIICLQEVDHYNFLNSCLSSIGYRGIFCSKPDSPCIYKPNNNGPDGCAMFYRHNKLHLISVSTRILEIWRVPSNQVFIHADFCSRETGDAFTVSTTHLKARQGALLAAMRNEQGKDIVNYVSYCGSSARPFIMCGDFNAMPSEAVISTIKSRLGLTSAYSLLYKGEEPPYTTWKVRADGEYCHTLDYIFYNKYCQVQSILALPTEDQIGKSRLPNLRYGSDHIALACDFTFVSNNENDNEWPQNHL